MSEFLERYKEAERMLNEAKRDYGNRVRKAENNARNVEKLHKREIRKIDKEIEELGYNCFKKELCHCCGAKLYGDHIKIGSKKYPLEKRTKGWVSSQSFADKNIRRMTIESTSWRVGINVSVDKIQEAQNFIDLVTTAGKQIDDLRVYYESENEALQEKRNIIKSDTEEIDIAIRQLNKEKSDFESVKHAELQLQSIKDNASEKNLEEIKEFECERLKKKRLAIGVIVCVSVIIIVIITVVFITSR